MLSQIKIVLVETSHPGNIGAVARAMKTMSMTSLCLVNPKHFPSAEATSRAAGSDDILSKAKIYDTLSDAIADCHVVFGTSARIRTISWPELTPRACAEKVIINEPGKTTAIVFGRENSGLSNEELDLCHYLLRIPCNSQYSSLNIAAAVQVICYELNMASQQLINPVSAATEQNQDSWASKDQMEQFYQHLHQTLLDIGFILHPDKSATIMRRLRRVFNRAQLDNKEVDMLRGILRMSQGNKRN
ncbi:MAG: RNA methyltransferase [Gammaproteobacteria bacterium]|nr:RNA methyltransferase [Gammaproteobacteria bacterium]